jgi:hypothetical protein
MAGPGIVVVASLFTGWLALSTDDGVVADDYYKRGLMINRKLERVERAASLKMTATVDVASDGAIHLTLESPLSDPQTMPAVVRVSITHPTRAGMDRQVDLVRGPDGRYAGRVDPVAIGRWLVIVETDAWRLPVAEVTGGVHTVRLGETPAAHS